MEKNIVIALLFVLTGTISAEAQNSLYADHKAKEVGDVLTVILQENISGRTNSDAENSSNAAAGAGGSASGNFLPFQPTFGTDVEVNYDSEEQIATSQGQLLEGYMSVEVTEITTGGNLLIEGSRSTEINGELHELNLTGLVRPIDINGNNQVLSYRVGNAQINYEKEGGVQRVKKKEGFLKRAILTGVGVVVGAVVITKAFN